MSKKRKWSEDYVQHGFICLTEKDGAERPQCISCSKVLSNTNLKPSTLKEHILIIVMGVQSRKITYIL